MSTKIYTKPNFAPLATLLFGTTKNAPAGQILHDQNAYSELSFRVPIMDILAFSQEIDKCLNHILKQKYADYEICSGICSEPVTPPEYNELFGLFRNGDVPYCITNDHDTQDLIGAKMASGVYGTTEQIKKMQQNDFISVPSSLKNDSYFRTMTLKTFGIIGDNWNKIRDLALKHLFNKYNSEPDFKGRISSAEFSRAVAYALYNFEQHNSKSQLLSGNQH